VCLRLSAHYQRLHSCLQEFLGGAHEMAGKRRNSKGNWQQAGLG